MRQVGDIPQLFSVLLGLRRFYFVRGELGTAHELGEQLLTLAQRLQDPGLLARAHVMSGEVLYRLGEFTQTQEHAEQGFTLYDSQQHRSHALLYGNDTGVACLTIGALALWPLGYPDQARNRMHEALTLAQALVHPFSLAMALLHAGWLYQLLREEQATQEGAEALITLSTEHGFVLFSGYGTVLRGWALAEQGQGEAGIAQIRQGLAAWRATGAELSGLYFLTRLAEAYGKTGQTEEGLNALAEARAVVDRTDARYYEAELYRLKGELLLNAERGTRNDELKTSSIHRSSFRIHCSAEAEAEACFHKAIEIARRQSAKSLELRAVTSLSRLWQSQGKKKQARRMLAEIYGWFTEGFDTKDLQEAKALLVTLGQ